MTDNHQRVILVGLDGATWNVIKPLVEKNKLPAFQQLIQKGVSAEFRSTIPPISPSAWNSIYTGVTPAKHSIFSFVKRTKNSYFYQPISANDRTAVPLWRHISNYGKRVIALNLPFSYPPDKINGIVTTGLGTPSRTADFIYPPEYRDSLLKQFPEFDVDFNEDLLVMTSDVNRFLHQIESVTDAQIDMAKYLMHHEQWDLFFPVFRATDVIQHYFWDNEELIYTYYKKFDDLLAYLLDSTDDNRTVMLCSDHGFGRVDTYVYINNVLQQMGLITIKPKRTPQIINAEFIQGLMLKLGLRNLVWKLKRNPLIEKVLKFIPSSAYSYLFQVDWAATKAFFYETSDGAIYINMEGREPDGSVTTEEYESVRRLIIENLKSLKDPVTGRNIIKQIFTREELYGGKCETAPDIILLKNDGFRLVGYNDNGNIFQEPVHGAATRPGDHTEYGVFLASGNDIKEGDHVTAEVYDIAPTIYHILGIPIPTNVDGNVLDIFKADSNLAGPSEYISEETERIRQRIEGLREKGKL